MSNDNEKLLAPDLVKGSGRESGHQLQEVRAAPRRRLLRGSAVSKTVKCREKRKLLPFARRPWVNRPAALPLQLLAQSSRAPVLNIVLNLSREVLRLTFDPRMKHLPELKNLIRNQSKHSRLVNEGVDLMHIHLRQAWPSHLCVEEARFTLSNSVGDYSGKARSERNEICNWLRIKNLQQLANLLEFPRSKLFGPLLWNAHCSSKVDLLDRQLVDQDLGEHPGLPPPANALHCHWCNTNKQRDDGSGRSCDSRDRIPVPASCPTDFHHHAHCLHPLLASEHSAMQARQAETVHG